jgi:hypothetical protein
VRAAVTVLVVLASIGVAIAVGIWFSWRSPMGLSEEESSLHPPISDGVGRPAGPDAEAMGVLDRGEIITGPPPPGGIPTDAPRPRSSPGRWHRTQRRRRRPRLPRSHP